MNRRLLLLAMAGAWSGPSRALYDPAPEAWLAGLEGAWRGSLTYRDFRDPSRSVTLPTMLSVALAAPSELVLHFVFDDGPNKTVHSYERMAFDLATGTVAWRPGSADGPLEYRVASTTDGATSRTVVLERIAEGGIRRCTVEASGQRLRLANDEVAPDGVATWRNRYDFQRPGG